MGLAKSVASVQLLIPLENFFTLLMKNHMQYHRWHGIKRVVSIKNYTRRKGKGALHYSKVVDKQQQGMILLNRIHSALLHQLPACI